MAKYYVVKNDGAMFKCQSCYRYDKANGQLVKIVEPDFFGVFHKDCLDDDWLANATEIPAPE